MTQLRAALWVLTLMPSFFWSLSPELQVGPNPPRGAHAEYRSYPAAGCLLIKGDNRLVLPEGSTVVLRIWTYTPQQDFPPDDTLRVVSR